MIKRKFGDSRRSETETAQVNETLAKVFCHNLVLIHEMHELGIDPGFWAESLQAGVTTSGSDKAHTLCVFFNTEQS
jgi:hypothetical protein